MEAGMRRLRFPLLLLCTVLASVSVFALGYRYDNKYTAPGHPAGNGVTTLDMARYEQQSLLYLIRGWEFYQYKALTPEEIPYHSPDAIVFIGQYGGFELGNPDDSPHGSGTYRMTVFADETPRDYALELPEIFSAYRVWINGERKAEMGSLEGVGYSPQTGGSLVTFTAAGQIEIVIAVTDYTHLYSGMVYPPAFGSPDAVYRLLVQRQMVYGAACAIALLTAVLCVLLGLWQRKSRGVKGLGLLALLCLFFVGYAGHPVVHGLGLAGEFWYDVEMMSHYGMFLTVIWLQGRLCGLSKKVYLPAVGAGALVCLWVPVYRHLLMDSAAGMYRFSRFLELYMVAAGIYLLAASVVAIRKGALYSKPLLCGFCVYAAANLYDKARPWFEPMRFFWHNETAGLVLLFIVGGIACHEAATVFRERYALEGRLQTNRLLLETTKERMRLQEEYVEATSHLVHDNKNRLLTAKTHLKQQAYSQLEQYLDGQLGDLAEIAPAAYTGHKLMDTFLSSAKARAKREEIRLEIRCTPIPESIPIGAEDLTGLLPNLLDNALEACGRIDDGNNRWIEVELAYQSGALILNIRNSYSGEPRKAGGRYRSSKGGSRHGYGLAIVEEVVERYGGVMEITAESGVFHVYIGIHPKERKDGEA